MAFGHLPNPRPPRNPGADEAKVAGVLYPRHPNDELNLAARQLHNAHRQLIGAAGIFYKREATETWQRIQTALAAIDDALAGLVEEGDDG